VTDYTRPLGRNEVGELNNKISIDVKVTGEALFKTYLARDWASARKFLASKDFKAMEPTVEFVSINNREN
jgi:hypothetical protein